MNDFNFTLSPSDLSGDHTQARVKGRGRQLTTQVGRRDVSWGKKTGEREKRNGLEAMPETSSRKRPYSEISLLASLDSFSIFVKRDSKS